MVCNAPVMYGYCDSIMNTIDVWPTPVFGPVTRNRLGKPATVVPRWAAMPLADHCVPSEVPWRPMIELNMGWWVTLKPVPKMSTSAGWNSPAASTTPSVTTWSTDRSTSETLSRCSAGYQSSESRTRLHPSA